MNLIKNGDSMNFDDLDIISYKSSLDDSFIVNAIYRENEEYEKFKNLAKENIAISDVNKKLIFIDGEELKRYSKDHLLAIEMHEIVHSYLNHGKSCRKNFEEAEADYIAIFLLKHRNFNQAAFILESLFFQRHHIHLDVFSKKYFEKKGYKVNFYK